MFKLIHQCDHLSGKLEMSGNLEHVREMSGMLLTVREMSGKKSCHGTVSQNCSLLDEYLHFLQKQCIATYVHSDFILRNH